MKRKILITLLAAAVAAMPAMTVSASVIESLPAEVSSLLTEESGITFSITEDDAASSGNLSETEGSEEITEEDPIAAYEARLDARAYPLVYDEAGVLTDDELEELNARALSITENNGCECDVLLVETLGDKDATSYADDWYDENGYGYGDRNSGILFLVATEDREYATCTTGDAILIFDDDTLYTVEDDFLEYLSDSDWYGAADSFLSSCDLLGYNAYQDTDSDEYSEIYDDNTYEVDDTYTNNSDSYDYRSTLLSPSFILMALLIGLVIAGIMFFIDRAKMKPTKLATQASNFIRPGSFNLTVNRDIYTHTTETRVRVHDDDDHGGGGSSVHISSSGGSHGGHSGSF